MPPFGQLLRQFRKKCKDPWHPDRILSQEVLGELVGAAMGMQGGYSGAAVSDWERGKSKIQADQRPLLIGLINTLYRQGGITSITEANELLEAGDYRPLNREEAQNIFPDLSGATNIPPSGKEPQTEKKLLPIFLDYVLLPLGLGQLQDLTNPAAVPTPLWPHLLTTSLRKVTRSWSAARFGRVLAWLWVWILNYAAIVPLLRWPFRTAHDAESAVVLYFIGSIVVPLFVGALSETKSSDFWNKFGLAQALTTRLYTHQGASVGFHVGYFPVFLIFLAGYYFHLRFPSWLEFLLVTLIPLGSYVGARMVPYNLFRAFGRLILADGWVFFVFVLTGPLWGLFFIHAYSVILAPHSGPIIILSALTIITAMLAWQFRRTGNTIIKAHWWVVVFGSAALIYQISVSQAIFSTVSLAGILFSLSALVAIRRTRVTLAGILSLLAALGLFWLLFQINMLAGCLFGWAAILIWRFFGKQHISLSPGFLGVILINAGLAWALKSQHLHDWQAAIAFGCTVVVIVLWEYKRSQNSAYSGA